MKVKISTLVYDENVIQRFRKDDINDDNSEFNLNFRNRYR